MKTTTTTPATPEMPGVINPPTPATITPPTPASPATVTIETEA